MEVSFTHATDARPGMLPAINVRRREIFYSVCRANKSAAAIVETPSPTLATTGLLDILKGLKKACMKISLNGKDVLALNHSGSTDNFIHPHVVKMCSKKYKLL